MASAELIARLRLEGYEQVASQLEDVASTAEKVEGLDPSLKVDADTTDAQSGLDDVKSTADDVDGTTASVTVDADTEGAQSGLDDVKSSADDLDGTTATVSADADTDAAQSGLDDVKSAVDDLDGTTATVTVDADTSGAEAGLASVGSASEDAAGSTDKLSIAARRSNVALSVMTGSAAKQVAGMAGATGLLETGIGRVVKGLTAAARAGEGFFSSLGAIGGAVGPMAGIAVGFSVVKGVIEELHAPAAAAKARVEELGKAFKANGQNALGYTTAFRDNFKEMSHWVADSNQQMGAWGRAGTDVASKIPIIGKAVKQNISTDLIGTMRDAGISMYELGSAMDAGGEPAARLTEKLRQAREEGRISKADFNSLSDFMGKYSNSAEQAAKSAGILNVSAEEANAIMDKQRSVTDPAKSSIEGVSQAWQTLAQDMRDGKVDTVAGADAINTLSDKLGISREQVIALAEDGFQKAKAAMTELSAVMSSADWGQTAITGAVAGWGQLLGQAQGLTGIAANTEAAYDSLGASIEKNGFQFDITTDKGRQNAAMVAQLGQSLIPQLSAAFADSGGSVDKFAANMDRLKGDVFQGLQREAGLTADQAQQVIDRLGVFDGASYQAEMKLLGAEQAQAQLQLLSGVIGNLPPEIQQRIALEVAAGDPTAAAAEVQAWAAGHPGTLYLNADGTPALNQAQATGSQISAEEYKLRLLADSTGVDAGAAAARAGVEGQPATMPITGNAEAAAAAASQAKGNIDGTQAQMTITGADQATPIGQQAKSTIDGTQASIDIGADIVTAIAQLAYLNAAATALSPRVTYTADVSQAIAGLASVVGAAAGVRPKIVVDADINAAIAGLRIVAAMGAATRPVATVDANIGPAMSGIAQVAAQRPRVPVEAYLASAPSAGSIAGSIGTVRVPIVGYVASMPRVTGTLP